MLKNIYDRKNELDILKKFNKNINLINNKDLITQNKYLGEGSEGIVILAKYKDKLVAIKYYKSININSIDNNLDNEFNLLCNISHKNIVKVYGLCVGKNEFSNYIGIVMQYAENGSLFNIIHLKKIKLTINEKYKIILDILQGINYLHSKDIMHRDIKLDNVLLCNLNSENNELNALISDFGFAKISKNTMNQTLCGTLSYMAPEVSKGMEYSKKADCYSIGIVIWEIFTELKPKMLTSEIIDKIPKNISNEIKHTIICLLDEIANKRPKIESVIDVFQKEEYINFTSQFIKVDHKNYKINPNYFIQNIYENKNNIHKFNTDINEIVQIYCNNYLENGIFNMIVDNVIELYPILYNKKNKNKIKISEFNNLEINDDLIRKTIVRYTENNYIKSNICLWLNNRYYDEFDEILNNFIIKDFNKIPNKLYKSIYMNENEYNFYKNNVCKIILIPCFLSCSNIEPNINNNYLSKITIYTVKNFRNGIADLTNYIDKKPKNSFLISPYSLYYILNITNNCIELVYLDFYKFNNNINNILYLLLNNI